MSVSNRQIVLRRRPRGLVGATDTESITTEVPSVGDGEALLRTTYVGVDAAVRTWLTERLLWMDENIEAY